mgnify:CR=1 FL=1
MSGIGRRYEADPRRREEIERDWAQVMAAQPPSQKKPPPQPAPPQTTSGNQFAASAPFQALTAAYQVYQANNDGTASSLGKRSTPASTPTKRRPYRRTKRPKDYNDRSTITTTTKTAETPVNPYDVVLGEAQDLMQAAYEAQALGRLKMASNYLLLVHTRLVGLGKKFDWVQRFQGREHLMSAQKGSQEHAATDTAEHHGGLKPTKLDMTMEEESPDYDSKPKAKAPQQCEEKKSEEEGRNTPPRHDVPPSNTISQAALNQLTNYLPQDIEMGTYEDALLSNISYLFCFCILTVSSPAHFTNVIIRHGHD